MKKKGFAVSAILYTMLLLFLVLLVGILNNLQNKKTVLDQLKTEVISSQIKTSVPVIKVNASNRNVSFDLSDNFGLIGYFVSTTKKIPEEEEWIDLDGDLELTVEWRAPEIGIYYVYMRNILGRVSMKEFELLENHFHYSAILSTSTYNATNNSSSYSASTRNASGACVKEGESGCYSWGKNCFYARGNTQTVSCSSSCSSSISCSWTEYYCPNGGTLSDNTCIKVSYSCPNGGNLSGTTCIRQDYTCPNGGTLNGTTCEY